MARSRRPNRRCTGLGAATCCIASAVQSGVRPQAGELGSVGPLHSSMAKNKFGIPEEVLARIRSRDKNCVYCRKPMIYPYVANCSKDCATIEHLNLGGPFYWSHGLQEEDIVLCCGSCNSSRGIQTLTDWFRTPYCIEKNVNPITVSAPVRSYLSRQAGGNNVT